jgi:uncharacterized protein (DUF433 family)
MKGNNQGTSTKKTKIIDRGCGPEIEDTRITVYTILEYLIGAWDKHRIAVLLNLRDEQVQAAIDYIDGHDLEVLREYIKILERVRAGNPTELQAKLDARHVQFQKLVRQIRAVEARAKKEIHELIRRHQKKPKGEKVHAGLGGGQ